MLLPRCINDQHHDQPWPQAALYFLEDVRVHQCSFTFRCGGTMLLPRCAIESEREKKRWMIDLR